jgi:hypothetical protein
MLLGEPFPLDRYLNASRTLALDEYDWTLAAKHPLAPAFERALVYMLRIEGQTLFYVRDLLNTKTAYIPEVASFLSVWLYEEERHSRILRRFLRERGIVLPEDDHARVRRASTASLRERAEAMVARWMANTTPHFVAVHMAWGAYQELTTLHAYRRVAEECGHPLLRALCDSIVKDERRHFAFYYQEARRFLEPPRAQTLARFLLSHGWQPVGFGVHAPLHVHFMVDWYFGDEKGQALLRGMDREMEKLPGLAGLGLYERAISRAKRVVAEGRARGSRFDDWVPIPVTSG